MSCSQNRQKASNHQTKEQLSRVSERIAFSERRVSQLRFPDTPSSIVLFAHHICASRFFRFQVFTQLAKSVGARIRKYEVVSPPFHFTQIDDLDLCNMDFSGLGEDGRDVVMFCSATKRSLDRIRQSTTDWKGVRILRDPRQVLVSNYFHHRDSHPTESSGGWFWDQLSHDKPVLRELPEEEGLLYELDKISKQVIERQLLEPFDDERILTIKLEDFSGDPETCLARIAEFLKVPEIRYRLFTYLRQCRKRSLEIAIFATATRGIQGAIWAGFDRTGLC